MGQGGQRSGYRPLTSTICKSSDPSEVACGIIGAIGPQRMYVADLDSLQGGVIDWKSISGLAELCPLYCDANWWCRNNLDQLRNRNVTDLQPIFSSEGLVDWSFARNILASRDDFVFSLDLNDGIILGNGLAPFIVDGDQHRSLIQIVKQLVQIGLGELILLDVARVGMKEPPAHLPLIRTLHEHFPDLSLIWGGGVTSLTDLQEFTSVGCQQVLVASSLHSGTLLNSVSFR